MDEIFDRIKTIKIKRKHLFLPLILTEVLGILVLVWFLRAPLTQKFLSISPSNYSLDLMNSDKQYLLKQGDFITGRFEPYSRLQIVLAPDGGKHSLPADQEGNFTFQVPQIDTREYRVLVMKEESDNLKPVKNLMIRVESNNKIVQFLNNLYNWFQKPPF